MGKNTVLLLANNCGGLISFRKELLTSLIATGYNVVVHIPHHPRINEVENLGCRVVKASNLERKGMNPLKDIALLKEYIFIIRHTKPSVVLTYTIKPNIYGGMASSFCKVPYIVNITGLGEAVENPGLLQKLTVALYRIAMHNASKIFFQNSANQQFFANRKINNNAHEIIPGSGVNLAHHHLESYPAPDKPIRFNFISRIMKQKGIEEYLACAKHFVGKAEFHILGDCEEDYKSVLDNLSKNGVIIYHGLQNDVRPYIAASHCLIHPSFYPEGISNVLLESAAAGRPVITTNRPGCREIVDNGISGFIVEQRNTQQLIEKVDDFIKLSYEQKKQMGLCGRRKVENEFDRNIVISAYLRAINSIV